jgi:hypothetical protein
MCVCVCVCVWSSVFKTLWVQAFSSSGRRCVYARGPALSPCPPEGERSETEPSERSYVCWGENANGLVLKV